jgi:indole-3-glycerol phosphate synthase
VSASGTVLDRILAQTRARVRRKQGELPLDRLLTSATVPLKRRPFAETVSAPGRVNVIAEFKRRSPSRGAIREDLRPAEVARAYESAGAAALSVLTEPDFFGGRLAHLRQARAATKLPALRKDFVIDLYQVWEALTAGADAVLLIVAVLPPAELKSLLRTTTEAGLDALVEVHDAAELAQALAAGARLIGVNNRDLRTLEVDPGTALSLAPRVPDDVVAVAESGIRSAGDLRRLREAGYDAFLVGEHLMSAPDPGAALRALLGGAA